jgi:hypothetical protein
MDWVEGDTLGVYLDRVASKSAAIAALRQEFATLADYLERNAVAHGDIQNENVIIASGALRLIDYDGMFVTGLPEGQGTERGHRHPQRDTKHFGPKMDRFAFIVLDTSLETLQVDPSLYRRFGEGGQAIIFKANDFADPASSQIFGILNGMPALRESAKKLAAICSAPITSVPSLSDFRAGRNIPTAVVPPAGTLSKAVLAPVYMGAFTVVDAKDFNAVMRRVGDKIELVGQIVSVKWGIGKRGRGKDRPYCFINFGIWNKESVKITIWAEGLSNMSTRPLEAWVGRWISVTGLVEPPYEGSHYGRPYRNVGITIVSDKQIVQISEQDANFRLGRGGAQQKQGVTGKASKPTNADILKDIRNGTDKPRSGPTIGGTY